MIQAAKDGARIVNMSLGFVPTQPRASETTALTIASQTRDVLSKAIRWARENGKDVLWVFAAGNHGRDAKYESPANLTEFFPENTMTVAAIDKDGQLRASSNRGSLVSVAAPGQDIYSTTPPECFIVCSYYGYKTGTSQATPFVSGLAALVLSKHVGFSAAQIKECILHAAQTVGPPLNGQPFHVISAPEAVICNQPPTAGFLMTFANRSVRDGDVLRITVPAGQKPIVLFNGGSPYSSDPDGNDTILSWEWSLDGAVISTQSAFSYPINEPVLSHNVSLRITDNGRVDAFASANIIVTEILPVVGSCVQIPATQGIAITPTKLIGTGGTGGPYTFSATGLPNRLTMASDGTISGTPTVNGTFSYTVTIKDKDGNTGTVNCSVAVNPAPIPASFVYASNSVGGITGYKIDNNSGSLSPLDGSPFFDPTCSGPRVSWLAADPQGHFLYVTEPGVGRVSVFAITPTNGLLNYLPGSTITIGGTVGSVIVHPNGKFAYTTNLDGGKISGFTIDSSGLLTPMPASPWYAAGGYAFSSAFDPSGKFMYVGTLSAISGFTVDASSGSLTPIPGSTVPGGERVSVHPNGSLLYTGGEYTVGKGYRIGSDGALTNISGLSYNDGRGQEIDLTGRFLYTSTGPTGSGNADSVYGYQIDSSSGNLVLLPGLPIGAGLHSGFTAIDPANKFLYVVNTHALSSNISAFAIDSDSGRLTPVPGAPFPNASGPITAVAPH